MWKEITLKANGNDYPVIIERDEGCRVTFHFYGQRKWYTRTVWNIVDDVDYVVLVNGHWYSGVELCDAIFSY